MKYVNNSPYIDILEGAMNFYIFNAPFLQNTKKNSQIKSISNLYHIGELFNNHYLLDYVDSLLPKYLVAMDNRDTSFKNGMVGAMSTINNLMDFDLIESENRREIFSDMEILVLKEENFEDLIDSIKKNGFLISLMFNNKRDNDFNYLLVLDQSYQLLNKINDSIDLYFDFDKEAIEMNLNSQNGLFLMEEVSDKLVQFSLYLSILEKEKIHENRVVYILKRLEAITEKISQIWLLINSKDKIVKKNIIYISLNLLHLCHLQKNIITLKIPLQNYIIDHLNQNSDLDLSDIFKELDILERIVKVYFFNKEQNFFSTAEKALKRIITIEKNFNDIHNLNIICPIAYSLLTDDSKYTKLF